MRTEGMTLTGEDRRLQNPSHTHTHTRAVPRPITQSGTQQVELLLPILTIKANEMHYFSNKFDKVHADVSDRSTTHHQEYLNTVYMQ
jgi:hypothetical protein